MKKKRICFFRTNNKIGDCVFSSFFIRELKKLFAQDELTLVIPAPADELYLNHPHIDKLVVFPSVQYHNYQANRTAPILLNIKLIIAFVRFWLHCWVHPYDILVADVMIHSWKNHLYFGTLRVKKLIYSFPTHSHPITTHVTSIYANLLSQLGAGSINTDYELFLAPQHLQQAKNFLLQHKLTKNNFFIVNPVGADSVKNMSDAQLRVILSTLNQKAPVVLLDYKQKYNSLKDAAILCPFSQILAVAALLQYARGIISPDTGIVHLADVFRKPILALYAHDKYFGLNTKTTCASINPNTHYLQSEDTVADIPLARLKQAVATWVDTLPDSPAQVPNTPQ